MASAASATANGSFVSFLLPFLFFGGFFQIMDKVAPWSIRAKTNGMVCAAQICFVFRVAGDSAQFGHSVGELALFAVLASTMFTERSAEFSLVPGGVDLGAGGGGGGGGGGRGGAVAVIVAGDFVFQTL